MKAIETAVYKLKRMMHSAPDEGEYSLTKREIMSLISAGELLASLALAVEVGAEVKVQRGSLEPKP